MAKYPLTIMGRAILVASAALLVSPAATGSSTLTITLSEFKTTSAAGGMPVVQRRAGMVVNGQPGGWVPVLASFTGGAPANLEARVIKAVGGAVVKDWAALDAPMVVGNKIFGTLKGVQQGGPYLLQIRDVNNATTVSNGTVKWGVGVCIAANGQSNMVGTFGAGNRLDIVPGTSTTEYDYQKNSANVGSFFGSYGFTNADGSSGSSISLISGGSQAFLRMLAMGLKAKYGYDVPVCLVAWAFNSTGLNTNMLPNGSNSHFWTDTGTTGGAIGLKSPGDYWAGDVEGVVFHQGETDAATSDGVRAVRKVKVEGLQQQWFDYVAGYGRAPADFFFLPAVLGVTGAKFGMEDIRAAVFDVELDAKSNSNQWPRTRIGWNCIDLDPLDGGTGGLHFLDQPGGNRYASWGLRRMLQSILFQLGAADYSGRGPQLTGAYTRMGDTIRLTVAHEAGTALTGKTTGNVTGFYANTLANFTGTDITVTATISGANTIDVTFPPGTNYVSVYLKYMGGKDGAENSYHPDLTNCVYDNAVYPKTSGTSPYNVADTFTGLPLLPTPDAIKVG